MIVRVFSQPDMSELGLHTRALLDVMLIDLGLSVRLLPPPPHSVNFNDLDPVWMPYQGLFATVIDGPYCNVVASNDPTDWSRLWTTNVTNILLTSSPPPPMKPDHIFYQGAFQAVIVPALEGGDGGGGDLHHAWVAAGNTTVIVLPRLWTGHHAQAIRTALIS